MMRHSIHLLLIICFSISACASAPPDQTGLEDPAWYKVALLYEQWEQCKALYHNARVPTIHDHAHNWGPERHRVWEVQSDLRMNNCRMRLKQAGVLENFTP